MFLNQSDIQQYQREGYLCPIDVFDANTAQQLRSDVEQLEKQVINQPELETMLKNKSHWVLPLFDGLARNPRVLDAVAELLGPDLLAMNVDLFIKEPHTPQFISWHQDLHYWGLDSDDVVTAWIALSPATVQSGCMRFIPASHTTIVDHADSEGDSNMLSRGQEVAVEVDENQAVYAELKPGQMSLHHGRLMHASTANQSDDRRIGVAIRYVKPSTGRASSGEKLGATLVRGQDRFGNFELVDAPRNNFESDAVANWKRLRAIEESILFAKAG